MFSQSSTSLLSSSSSSEGNFSSLRMLSVASDYVQSTAWLFIALSFVATSIASTFSHLHSHFYEYLLPAKTKTLKFVPAINSSLKVLECSTGMESRMTFLIEVESWEGLDQTCCSWCQQGFIQDFSRMGALDPISRHS